MKTISNKTQKPLRISLPGGRFLHLGPGQTGQIALAAAERPSVRKLVDAGEIEILDQRAAGEGRSADGSPLHESTHGHQPQKMVLPKGNR